MTIHDQFMIAHSRYVKVGYDINCSQKPLGRPEYEDDLEPISKLKRKK